MQVAATPSLEPVPTLSLIDSLYQSRQTLLYDTFAIFKSPSRPRTGTISESPHTLKRIATATVAIGPHSFAETQLFLCEWSQPKSAAAQPKAHTLNPAAITPALIARLNAASQTDPALAAILQKAASGQATPDELSGLARYIDEMRQEEEQAAPPAATAAPAPASSAADAPMPTHPSLVLDFRELSGGEQFILPAHYIFSPLHSHVPSPNGAQDVLLSFFVFPSERASTPSAYKGKQRVTAVGSDPHAPVPVDMIVQGCGDYARECMFRAARNGRPKDEKVELWWRQMINVVPPRTHVLFIPPRAPSTRDATPLVEALPASAALSRSASQHAGTPGVGGAGQKRGGTPKEAPAAKKQKTAPKKKASRPSTGRSKSGSAAALAGSSTASPGPSSLAGSPAPGAPGSPAPSEGSGRGGKRKAPARKAPARSARGKAKARYQEDSDDDFDVKAEA